MSLDDCKEAGIEGGAACGQEGTTTGFARTGHGGAGDGPEPARDLRFPPLEPGRAAALRGRMDLAIAREPRHAELRARLLELGGHEVVLSGDEPNLAPLLERGRSRPGAGSKAVPMTPSMCHSNAALLWKASGGSIGVGTGYALSDDGLWRQHSWSTDRGVILETTAPRVLYFGRDLMPGEAYDLSLDYLGPVLADVAPDDIPALFSAASKPEGGVDAG